MSLMEKTYLRRDPKLNVTRIVFRDVVSKSVVAVHSTAAVLNTYDMLTITFNDPGVPLAGTYIYIPIRVEVIDDTTGQVLYRSRVLKGKETELVLENIDGVLHEKTH